MMPFRPLVALGSLSLTRSSAFLGSVNGVACISLCRCWDLKNVLYYLLPYRIIPFLNYAIVTVILTFFFSCFFFSW